MLKNRFLSAISFPYPLMQQIKIIGAANRSFDKTNLKIY